MKELTSIVPHSHLQVLIRNSPEIFVQGVYLQLRLLGKFTGIKTYFCPQTFVAVSYLGKFFKKKKDREKANML